MAVDNGERYLRLAIDLAEKGRGRTSPNPLVGAVIVSNGQIVGRGYHKKAGSAHAEINAIIDAGSDTRGATLYVNLEPCCHYGRTRPCTTEIIKAGIREVVFSLKDPNPAVRGKGAAQLRKAGVKVRSGLLRKEAEKLNEVYLKYIRTGLPFVVLKTAQTLDGRIATSTGDSRWITGVKARKIAHRLRAECDAVAVGAATVRADNPQLTVRLVKGRNPYRIILSRNLNFPRSINLFRNNQDSRTIVATTERSADRLRMKNVIVWKVKENRDGLSPQDFLKKAAQFGITSLLVEGGSALATSFLSAGLIDKHYVFISPRVIGLGVDTIGNLGLKKMADAIVYNNLTLDRSCLPDLLLIGYPEGK